MENLNEMEIAEKTMFVLCFFMYVIVVVNGLGYSGMSDIPVIASCKYTAIVSPIRSLTICMDFNITPRCTCCDMRISQSSKWHKDAVKGGEGVCI